MQEVKDNLPKFDLQLSTEEINELIQTLDKNSDGTVNEPEFILAIQYYLFLTKKKINK